MHRLLWLACLLPLFNCTFIAEHRLNDALDDEDGTDGLEDMQEDCCCAFNCDACSPLRVWGLPSLRTWRLKELRVAFRREVCAERHARAALLLERHMIEEELNELLIDGCPDGTPAARPIQAWVEARGLKKDTLFDLDLHAVCQAGSAPACPGCIAVGETTFGLRDAAYGRKELVGPAPVRCAYPLEPGDREARYVLEGVEGVMRDVVVVADCATRDWCRDGTAQREEALRLAALEREEVEAARRREAHAKKTAAAAAVEAGHDKVAIAVMGQPAIPALVGVSVVMAELKGSLALLEPNAVLPFRTLQVALLLEVVDVVPELKNTPLLQAISAGEAGSLLNRAASLPALTTIDEAQLLSTTALSRTTAESLHGVLTVAALRSAKRDPHSRATRACAARSARPASALGEALVAARGGLDPTLRTCIDEARAALAPLAPALPVGDAAPCRAVANGVLVRGVLPSRPTGCTFTVEATGRPEVKVGERPVYDDVVVEEDNPAWAQWSLKAQQWREEYADLKRVANTLGMVGTSHSAESSIVGERCDTSGVCKPVYQGGGSAGSSGWSDEAYDQASRDVAARLDDLERKLANEPPWKIQRHIQKFSHTETTRTPGYALQVTGELRVDDRAESIAWSTFSTEASKPSAEQVQQATAPAVKALIDGLRNGRIATLNKATSSSTGELWERAAEARWLRVLLLGETDGLPVEVATVSLPSTSSR